MSNMNQEYENCGKKNWLFCDGDLPPSGDSDPIGHESLMLFNMTSQDADIIIDVFFEDREPVKGISVKLYAERVKCLRLDKPIGEQKYQIPKGQYALAVHSTVDIVAAFGRLDVQQPNMSYYSVQGYSY